MVVSMQMRTRTSAVGLFSQDIRKTWCPSFLWGWLPGSAVVFDEFSPKPSQKRMALSEDMRSQKGEGYKGPAALGILGYFPLGPLESQRSLFKHEIKRAK